MLLLFICWFIVSFVCSSVRSFICLLVLLSVRPSVLSWFVQFVRRCVNLPARPIFVGVLTCQPARSASHSILPPPVRIYVRSSVHSLVRSFVRSFVRSIIQSIGQLVTSSVGAVSRLVNQPGSPVVGLSVSRSVGQSVSRSVSQSACQSVGQLVSRQVRIWDVRSFLTMKIITPE